MQNTVTTVLGKKGSGKTTLVKEIMQPYPRVIVVDSLAEYGPECGCRPCWGFDESLKAIGETREQFRVSLRCRDQEDNLDLMRVCFEHPRSLIVVEEASLYCSSYDLPEEIATFLRYGRHRELDLVFVARRPSELHRDVTAQSDLIVSFRQDEPRDTLYLRARMGEELAERARTLPDYAIVASGDLDRAPGAVLLRMIGQGEVRRTARRLKEDIAVNETLDRETQGETEDLTEDPN